MPRNPLHAGFPMLITVYYVSNGSIVFLTAWLFLTACLCS